MDVGADRAISARHNRDGTWSAIYDVNEQVRDAGKSLSEEGAAMFAGPASSEAAGGDDGPLEGRLSAGLGEGHGM